MRGSPTIQAILMIAVFLLAGWPTYRLTRPAGPGPGTTKPSGPDSPSPQSPKSAASSKAKVSVICASAPTDFSLKYTNVTVLAGKGPQASFTEDWVSVIPAEGADLIFEAHWPVAAEPSGANPAVARVTIELTDGRRVERSFWAGADGAVRDVLTIPASTDGATTN